MAEETKEVKIRKEAGGNDVQARGLARICLVYFEGLSIKGKLREMGRVPFPEFQRPGVAEDVAVGDRSSCDPQGDRVVALF